jgi:drug/metabolite transporter (DMT)-like permease
MSKNFINIIVCTIFALLAFAGNSVLCRVALGEGTIDAASFTAIRLASGIAALFVFIFFRVMFKKKSDASSSDVLASETLASNNLTSDVVKSKGSWLAASMLFIYAAAFSYGYISLDTGVGALILFGAVQITMVLAGVASGNRLHYSEWIGLVIAFSGFVYLVLPNLSTPSLDGFILMTVSGIAWGIYTLLGRNSKQATNDTAYNFLRTSPFVVLLIFLTLNDAHMTLEGVLLAALSGAIASGAGYAVWYIAISGLSVTQAAVVQLFVPIIAALGGVMFTEEVITLRLVESSVLVLGGILTVIVGRRYFLSR